MSNTESLGDNISPIILEEGAPLTCTLDINHRSADEADDDDDSSDPGEPRRFPKLESMFLRRLLQRMDATLSINPCPTTSLVCDMSYSISFTLTQGVSPLSPAGPTPSLRPEEEAARQPFQPNFKLAKEPTLEELAIFTETSLKGRKAVFHASETSTFAHHLTSYLTNWRLDLQHIPLNAAFDDEQSQAPESKRHPDSGYNSSGGVEGFTTNTNPANSQNGSPTSDGFANKADSGPSFIIIDDDVQVLRQRLSKFRPETPYPLHLHPRKRPSLATNHRPRSSPHVRQFLVNAPPGVFFVSTRTCLTPCN